MNKGKVKFFDEARGFGFIIGDNGQELFVHKTNLKSEIRENDEVTFDIEDGKKGPSAINVTLV
jgi:CspA family cold shock protein